MSIRRLLSRERVEDPFLKGQAKMLHELLPDMKKVFKKLWEHRLITKAQRMQMKAQKQQSTAHNSENDTWTFVEYDKSHQNIAGTQGNYEKTKTAEENAKATKYCAQQQNMMHELLAGYEKSHQNTAGHTS